MTKRTRFPIRLLVHFQRSHFPLVQVTDARLGSAGEMIGAGTRAIDLTDKARRIALPDGEKVTVAHVLDVLAALSNEGN